MKIAHITWITYPNFGTFLQAFALQSVLKKWDCDSTLINDVRFTYFASSIKKRLKDFVNWFRKPERSLRLYRTLRNYRQFARKFLKIDSEWKDTTDLVNKYDIFICGSDQIWSPILKNHYSGFYFAAFVPESKLTVAYAPSFGTTHYSDEYAQMVRPWLAKFNSISVWESVSKPVVEAICGRTDVQTTLDPTLLLNSDEWRALLSGYESNLPFSRYMLVYLLTYNEDYLCQIRKISNERGLKIVCLGNDDRLRLFSDKYIQDAGPIEFLDLVDKADYVITDSFHGTIFSFQFRRPFLTLKRFEDNTDDNQNSRVENLFEILDIRDNFYNLKELSTLTLPGTIDWYKAQARLDVEREASLNYLQKALQWKN